MGGHTSSSQAVYYGGHYQHSRMGRPVDRRSQTARGVPRLDRPVLYMMGSESPASSRGVGRLLTEVLPRVQVLELRGLGHMGPVTHSPIVNNAIASFLRQELTRTS
jgi:pimeloyl-ACP methyl ester carboxylesterase